MTGKLIKRSPWIQAGIWVRHAGEQAWQRLDVRERRRLRRLLVQSRGRPSNLSARERTQLYRIMRKALNQKSAG